MPQHNTKWNWQLNKTGPCDIGYVTVTHMGKVITDSMTHWLWLRHLQPVTTANLGNEWCLWQHYLVTKSHDTRWHWHKWQHDTGRHYDILWQWHWENDSWPWKPEKLSHWQYHQDWNSQPLWSWAISVTVLNGDKESITQGDTGSMTQSTCKYTLKIKWDHSPFHHFTVIWSDWVLVS